ncbi:hypothetical protein [Paenarthrobacter sp. A20]|uniref:hypothetical protein n=1 Tax=Paenarthrobacter sp. A20 TaxID=2817891 RepID=UPI00209C8B0A|nr:hypothetical protein [Paenarthrobacter sp. A20]MCP1414400.1 hypothetical protein [Paenarthrobacter sp. A20]
MPRRKTIYGIDPYAPGGIDQLMAHHRATFGDAVMEDGGEGSGEGEGQQEQQQAEGAQDGEQQQAQAQEGANPWDDPEAAKAEIERLRKENGRTRTNAKTEAADEARNELVQSLGKALGLVKDGGQAPTVEDLTQKLTTATESGTQAQAQLAVYKTASKHGADPDALLDSAKFLSALKGLDPNDSAKIEAAIKKAVTENPKLKTVQAAGAGGADFNGGTGEKRTAPTTLTGALDKHYGA